MNLGQFHDRVKNAIKRGTSQDTFIPLWTAEAALTIEQNYTFSWMRRIVEVTVDPLSVVPNQISMPNARVKSISYIRPVDFSNPPYKWYGDRLKKVEPDEVIGVNGGNPLAYYIDGLENIYLDSLPGISRTYQMRYNEYTDWPLTDAATPALLQRGFNLLLYQTLLIFAAEQRDDRMIQSYGALHEQAQARLLMAEEELKFAEGVDGEMVLG